MNYFVLVFSGVLIGLVVAAPIGPVNLICIRRTLAFGPVNGFVAGLGAALGDGIFAGVTAFGLTAVAEWIEGYSFPLQFAGGTLLIIFGIHTFIADPLHGRDIESAPDRVPGGPSLFRTLASTFALTITNPTTLFGFAALFTGLGVIAVHEDPSFISAGFVIAGVVAGSVLWWFTLTTVVGLFHARIDTKVMKLINHTSGIAICLFGIAVLGHATLARLF